MVRRQFILSLLAGLLFPRRGLAILRGSGAAGPSLLINQNFEGTGTDNSETWTINGQCDPDYASNVLRGSQSLRVKLDGSLPSAKSPVFGDTGEVWVHFMFSTNYNPSGVVTQIVYVRNAADDEDVFRAFYTGSNIRIYNGTSFGEGAFTIAADHTDYHFWLHLDAANKAGGIYAGTSTSRGSVIASVSGNATATGVAQLNFTGPTFRAAGSEYIVDQVIVDDAEFTTVDA